MKKEEIDKLISESLSKDDAEFYKNLDHEEGVFKMWGGLYKGKTGWLAAVQTVFITIFVVIAIYCGYHFFTVESTPELLRYGAVMFIAMISIGMMKLWLWMQMDKNTILREMKRIEYQVAVLIERIR
jgi:drug/metabolite transporter superfamily protein YnfA